MLNQIASTSFIFFHLMLMVFGSLKLVCAGLGVLKKNGIKQAFPFFKLVWCTLLQASRQISTVKN